MSPSAISPTFVIAVTGTRIDAPSAATTWTRPAPRGGSINTNVPSAAVVVSPTITSRGSAAAMNASGFGTKRTRADGTGSPSLNTRPLARGGALRRITAGSTGDL